MNTAKKGRTVEHEIQHIFEEAGFSAMRGAASHGEVFDTQ
jgi:Holliday junction resolvase